MTVQTGIKRVVGILWGVCAWAGIACAQDLVVTLSTREVAIHSNFTGAEITAFGLIERDVRQVTRAAPFDVLITVKGPNGEVTLHQKDRLGPIWLTTNRRSFQHVPLYFSTLSARPLTEIVDSTTAQRLKASFVDYLPEIPSLRAEQELEEASVREALLHIRRNQGAILDDPNGVTMVRPNLFSAQIRLPGKAPTGLYLVNIAVLSEGVLLRQSQAGFVVRKVGFDAAIANAARTVPWLYAILTILMAILLGWISNLIFRRD